MYTKISRYMVQPEKKEEFLDIQQEISDLYLNSMGGRMQFLRNENNSEEWIVLQQFESRDLFDRRIQEVLENLAETDLEDRLRDLLTAPVEENTQDYYMFMEVISED
ncbi:antibiotic biosynthesis monooxygenase [Proteiniclasticum sp. QWL-01]|uniref:antibiotic biosynthesis monooxygenase family protein n=1 Tax=Proteiniclasticum sp. QWL-01 TaxID=3036945 RepID=UPI002410AA87|nr:antibiotic biosynthesis monooxygenase [Proteiniclasticum sp. QWL-01]WFF71747.1 antibiotic biosynthesis monooxygenase [Proteiniclasticum sp. QWL-01]